MHVVVNGAPREIEPSETVGKLLARLDLAPIRVAVELNEDLVPRGQFDHTALRDGDRLEIVTFVGGG